jgi:polyhydroxyalkanoate synthesis repressor PhaR
MSDQKKTGSQHSGAKAGASAKASANGAQGRVVIKKYANRRLYNTASSSYVTLEHLSEMVKEGVDFVVFDAKTNEDITRSVLTQIIFDEESRGQNLLPIQFLRQLIGFYGNSMQAFLPSYLELSLDSFTRQQERMRTQMGAIAPGLAQGLAPNLGAGLGTVAGPQFLEEQVKQNLAMFDRAMKMFSPFAYVRPEDSEVAAAPAPAAAASAAPDDSLNDLKKKIEEMQEQISRLASKG